MKANELMIGDLLKWKEQPGFNDEDRNMVLRVRNIFDNTIKIDGRFELYHISLFEPIPLTSEILEKNGFVTNDEQGNWKGYRIYSLFNTDKSCIFMLKLYEKDSIVEISLDMSPYYIVFKFVHQLQHALRLCVDKTIEL